ncbi:phosphotransferase [Actinoplanes sp. KI2]|uniref:phosphotransferase n=1 Tax=Actinoplanes sp. KI2 TaxID=2983315 RepID=UPI0021D56CE4|nr:phosphotransferase [Actinoplanes sp. KI2]MCU7730731.1 phosphotransferase [Actinoplanes sp. KI2]
MQYPLTAHRRDTVLALLRPWHGGSASLVAEESLGHGWAPVTRLTFDRDLPGVGRTVVVKTRRVDGPGHGGFAHLRREEAALRTAAHTGVTARVIVADQAAGVVVTTDLEGWPTVESVLLGTDADAATHALVQFGAAVGRLHAGTRGAGDGYRQALAGLGAPEAEAGPGLPWPGVDSWRDVEVACAGLGLPDARAAAGDAAFVRDRLADAGPFAALTHTDLNPGNALVTPHGVRLVDFEGAIFGHLGFDASFLHFPFPTYSAHWATLPDSVVTEADRAYRGELAAAMPGAIVGRLDQALAVGAAAALAVRVQRLPLLAAAGQPPRTRRRRRAQLVQQIQVFTRLAERAAALPAMADWFSRLAEAMSARWPDATTPPPATFPAFRTVRG